MSGRLPKIVKCFITKPHEQTALFVAHHPDVGYDYKHTRPVPKEQRQESILKVDSRHMITEAPNLEQLQTLTYTPARYWHQYPGKAKRQKYIDSFNDNVDRPGLTS